MLGIWQEEVPETALARLGLEVLENRRVEEAVAGRRDLLARDRFGWVDEAVHEIEQFRAQRFDFWTVGRIPRAGTIQRA